MLSPNGNVAFLWESSKGMWRLYLNSASHFRSYPSLEEARYYLEKEVEESMKRGNQIDRRKENRVELIRRGGLRVWREKFWIAAAPELK